jgi:hypothetical protein
MSFHTQRGAELYSRGGLAKRRAAPVELAALAAGTGPQKLMAAETRAKILAKAVETNFDE